MNFNDSSIKVLTNSDNRVGWESVLMNRVEKYGSKANLPPNRLKWFNVKLVSYNLLIIGFTGDDDYRPRLENLYIIDLNKEESLFKFDVECFIRFLELNFLHIRFSNLYDINNIVRWVRLKDIISPCNAPIVSHRFISNGNKSSLKLIDMIGRQSFELEISLNNKFETKDELVKELAKIKNLSSLYNTVLVELRKYSFQLEDIFTGFRIYTLENKTDLNNILKFLKFLDKNIQRDQIQSHLPIIENACQRLNSIKNLEIKNNINVKFEGTGILFAYDRSYHVTTDYKVNRCYFICCGLNLPLDINDLTIQYLIAALHEVGQLDSLLNEIEFNILKIA